MAETAASAAVEQYVAQQHSTAEVDHVAESFRSEQPSVVHLQQQQQQHLPAEDPQADSLQQHWQQLCSSIKALDCTSDLLVRLVQSSASQQESSVQLDNLQLTANSSYEQQTSQHSCPSNASVSNASSSAAVDELQQQLSALQAEKQRIEADRQDMALQQGQYKGTIAQLEGALAFSERKVKDQLTTIDTLQGQVTSLTAELQEARGAAAQTPDRCRTAAKALQEQADRAATFAQKNEAQVRKLRHIVQLEARQLSELLDFAEQERQMLLEKETSLQQELEQLRDRAIAAEGGASDAMAESAALEQQLGATKRELAACQARVEQLEGMLADSEARLQQAHEQAALLAADRDAAARNLLRAEAELNDVSEYSTKMFRQVRFISHVLDKNSAVLGKLPEFASLTRDLRAFVAANSRTWEGSTATAGVHTAAAAAATATVSNADTTASGMRDVAGKA